jgi:quercetin dioxygenase-like cupin family protein
MLYVVRGSIMVGRRSVRMGETLYGEETITAHAEEMGATLWRWELSDPRQPAARINTAGVYSRDKLVKPLATVPEGELLWRGDSVGFPAGGCAYLHRHQGPGIRCLIEGELRVDTNGGSHNYGVGDAWFEAGPDPVFAQAGDRPTRFIRVMILPRALIGKSSIQYVNAEDKEKPKSQQYRVFVDAPLTWN